MPTVTDEEIIELIRNGGNARNAGIRALYQSVGQQMLRFFVYRGVSSDESKDILQETIIKIVRGIDSFKGDGTARAWFWQIARNCLTDFLRKQSRLGDHESVFDSEAWQKLEETTPDPVEHSPRQSIEECVADGLATFGEKMPERAYVLTLQMDGASIEEIGKIIGRTVAATKQYLYECRKKIQPFISRCNELLNA